MGLIYEYFVYDGKSSEDFKVRISGGGTFDSPQRDVETISVPGRNGNLHIDKGRFENINITYDAFIFDDFAQNYPAFKAFLNSKTGYKRLEDSYHPDYYRRAIYRDELSPKMSTRNMAGTFSITFDCDPRCFLKKGETPIPVVSGASIKNDTLFPAKPLIRVYGTGTLSINDVTFHITTADGYTDVDCELQEAYKGTTNCNGNIILDDGVFPELIPGINTIVYNGFSNVEITPRWWTI